MKKIRVRRKRLGTIAHYLVVACEYLVVIFLAIWLNIVLKSPCLFIIFIEESNLKSRFGQEWVDYVKIVPRWFPRLGRTHNNISVN